MVETRRSSASSSSSSKNKRLSSSPTRNPKRSKVDGASLKEEPNQKKKDHVIEDSPNLVSDKKQVQKENTTDQIMKELNQKKKSDIGPPDAEIPWGKLLSQSSENPHLPICSPNFLVGHSPNCDLQLPSGSTVLCKLKLEEQRGVPIASLKILGSKGVVQVNGKIMRKNSDVILTAGDELRFSSSGKHAYIFQQLLNKTTSVLPSSLSIAEPEDVSVKEVKERTFETGLDDPSLDEDTSLLESITNLNKDDSAYTLHPPNG